MQTEHCVLFASKMKTQSYAFSYFEYSLISNNLLYIKWVISEESILQNVFNNTRNLGRKTGISCDWPSYVPSSLIDFYKSLSSGHTALEVLHCVGLSCVSTLCSCE